MHGDNLMFWWISGEKFNTLLFRMRQILPVLKNNKGGRLHGIWYRDVNQRRANKNLTLRSNGVSGNYLYRDSVKYKDLEERLSRR